MSIAQLGYEIDSSQALEAERNLGRMDDAAQRAEGGADGLDRKSTALAATFRRMAPLVAGLAASLAGMFSVRAVLNAAETYETRMARIEAIIRATGGTAGRTSRQLEQQAQSLARATLESVDGVMQAQQVLLTFRNVSGDVFDRTIRAAADLSAAMGQDMVSSTRQLARALEDPIQGVTALTRSGTVFTQQQRDMIRTLVESGRTLEAQNFILEELEGQYGGASEAASALSHAKDSLLQSVTNLLVSLNESLGISDRLAVVYEALSSVVQFLADNINVVRNAVILLSIALAVQYRSAIVLATQATYAFVSSLVALRTIIITTGFGALIVGAAYLIDLLFRLRSATGSWGEALSALGDVALGVWQGITVSAQAIQPALAAVWAGIKADFFNMLAEIVDAWQDALRGFGANLQMMRVVPGIGGSLGVIGDALQGLQGGDALRGRATRAHSDQLIAEFERDQIVGAGFDRAREAVARLNEILDQNTDASSDASDAAADLIAQMEGLGDTIGGGGGGRDGEDDTGLLSRFEALQDELRTQAEQVEIWYQEAQETLQWALENERITLQEHAEMKLQIERLYQEQLAAIRAQAAGETLSRYGDLMGGLQAIAQQGGEGMTRIARIFGAAQAFINTMVGASEALKLPFPANLAAMARVVASGMGLVNAIRGGGSSGAGSAPASASGVSTQQQPIRRTIVDLRGDDWIKNLVEPVITQIYNASEDGQVVFAR